MTHLLWKYYWEDDVGKFRRLLAPTSYNSQAAARSPNIASGGPSPSAFGTSPRAGTKPRKASGFGGGPGSAKAGAANLGRAEVNSRDHAGLTVLLRAASSTAKNALAFVQALLEHPAIDLYVQDPESGWNALHRALYAGNISVARLLLEKERRDSTEHRLGASVNRVGQLIKTKDHEGNSPFDLYNATIAERLLKAQDDDVSDDNSDSDADSIAQQNTASAGGLQDLLDGEEIFAFGSNKNISLGFGDHDDRQFPERVNLRRPDHLLRRFYEEYLENAGLDRPASFDLSKIPALVLNRQLRIHDVVLSKLHSAVLTSDPVSNLYICGIGRGGRLGLGDENTHFTYTPVQGGLADRKVIQVALGQNHSMAITDKGELWTWGSNTHSQLGYSLPAPSKPDEDPMSPTPRQVFGPLKNQPIVGIAASSIHSVAHTTTSLFCWGKNVGQLALTDADSRSLEVQSVPRKVAASMFSSPIVMVSAIDKATTVLLQNHTVCVFTGYGYHYVRFPFIEPFANYHLSRVSMSTRYEAARNKIQYIASGGETIAAVTGRGDLFTMALNHKIDSNLASTSTTNPSKLKGAITQPQCIWSARKDGVRSIGVGEHGSVIISTESGAVWRRIKRVKAKDAYVAGSSETKRKDFKFQRVPYITKVATVRASPFGAFAAIRRDSTVMKDQIAIDEQSLWEDIAPLNCLAGFEASEPSSKDKDTLSFWNAEVLKERLGSIAYEVLKSPDLEADLDQHLKTWSYGSNPLGAAICTSASPDLQVPVHTWLLSARSSVLRSALAQFRKTGHYEHSELFTIDEQDNKIVVTFQSLDLISLLNLVLYLYEDKVIPAWNFTRQAAALAYRYRQIRIELMRVAMCLNMTSLEAGVRIQTKPQKCMDKDFRLATHDRTFFEDGDALLELDGLEVPVHSTFICQRCPWFEGLFHGRSGGLWLASRRAEQDPQDRVNIDLKHMEPRAFKYVLQFLYGDLGAELFDSAVSTTLDDFLGLVMDVMAIADELMLDRLSQICQQVMGRFVNTRSIAYLLNEIGPFAITEFKDAGLEYICLQMETMLENHLLDDLDEDLLLELDEVVRENQAEQLYYSRKDQTEERLVEEYPELAQDIDEERQRRVREMAFKAAQKDDERKLSSSLKAKYGSLDDFTTLTPDRTRRVSRAGKNEPFSPDLRPKQSHADLMFDMDDEDSSAISSPLTRPHKGMDPAFTADFEQLPSLAESWQESKGQHTRESSESPLGSPPATPSRPGPKAVDSSPAPAGNPWRPAALPTARVDLGDIIRSESTSQPALSASLAAQRATEADRRPSQTKMSQKERKKQQQAQTVQAAQQASQPPKAAWEKPPPDPQPSPWKVIPPKGKTPLKDVLSAESRPTAPVKTKPLVTAETTPTSVPRRTASPDTRFSGQSRVTSASTSTAAGTMTPSKAQQAKSAPAGSGSASSPAQQQQQQQPTPARALVPHSKSYLSPAPKTRQPSAGASMADIIGQQQREQEIVREAVAKRSLQEIQQEQAFQEWWDAESRRTQEEEARREVREREKDDNPRRSGRRGRSGRMRGGAAGGAGGAGVGVGDAGVDAQAQAQAGAKRERDAGGSRGGKARGRGRDAGGGGSASAITAGKS